MTNDKPNLLVNLPSGFFGAPQLQAIFGRLESLANVRRTSHDTPEQIQDDLAWADAVIMWSWPCLDQRLLDKAPRLRFAGHLNVTQTGARACLKRGIAVSEARHGWSPAVAELALGLILTGLRKISHLHLAMRQGTETWLDFGGQATNVDPDERQLTGRSVGIVGFGRIGQRLAELLGPFHADLRAYDPYLPPGVAEKYGAKLVALPELFGSSEIVVLCAANNAGTEHLVGKKEVDALCRGAILVNVARASVVDMNALLARVEKGEIYAMLDVFEQEPLQADSPLRRLPNAFLTPHRGGGIMESLQRILGMVVDDYEAFLTGGERRYPVTEETMNSLPE